MTGGIVRRYVTLCLGFWLGSMSAEQRAILDTLFGPCFGSVAWPWAGANEHGAARVKLTLCTQCCL